MPKRRCPFHDCEYEAADVDDALAIVLISVHWTGTHTALTASAAPCPAATAKEEKVRHPTVSAEGSS